MEPLTAIGTVASVVQLAGTAFQLSKTLYSLGSAVGSANDDLHDLADDLKIFSQSLTLLSRLLEDSKAWYSDDIYVLTAKIITDCAELYVKIDKILAKLGGNGKRVWKTRVKFVYKEGEIRKLLKRLRDMKGTLATILMSLQVDLQLSLLKISSSSKIQRTPERPLQPETLQMLKDAQNAVDTNEVVSKYTPHLEQLAQLADEVIDLPSTSSEQEPQLPEFDRFVMLPIPVAKPTVYGSDANSSFGTMSGKSPPILRCRKAIHSDNDWNLQSSTECSPDISLRRSISMDSFKSAVSFQEVKPDFINRIDAVQEVLHAFRTALETLNNLVRKRDLKQNEQLYSASQDLKSSLEKGEKEIGMVYKSHYDTLGQVYGNLFNERYKKKFQEITSELLKEIVLVLHMQSADHVVICRNKLEALYRQSETNRQQAIVMLHAVGVINTPSETKMANEERARAGPVGRPCIQGYRRDEVRKVQDVWTGIDSEVVGEGLDNDDFKKRNENHREYFKSLEDMPLSEPKHDATTRFRQRGRGKETARSNSIAELIRERKLLSATTKYQSERASISEQGQFREQEPRMKRVPIDFGTQNSNGDDEIASDTLPSTLNIGQTTKLVLSSTAKESSQFGGASSSEAASSSSNLSPSSSNTSGTGPTTLIVLSRAKTPMKRSLWWSNFKKTASKPPNLPLPEDLIDLDIADPETIMYLRAEDRVAPKIPGSSPLGSPTIDAFMDSWKDPLLPVGPEKDNSSILDYNRDTAPEMSLPFIGYTFNRFEHNFRDLDPSTTIPSFATKDHPSSNNTLMSIHGKILPTNNDTDGPRSNQDPQTQSTMRQRRAEILAKKAKLQELREARANRNSRGKIIGSLIPIHAQTSTSSDRKKLNASSTEFQPSPFTNLEENTDTNHKDDQAIVSELSTVEYGQIGIDSDRLQDLNPKQAYRILMRRQLRERFEKDFQKKTMIYDKNGDENNSLMRPQDNMDPSLPPSLPPSPFLNMSSSNSANSNNKQEGNRYDSRLLEDNSSTYTNSVILPETIITPEDQSNVLTVQSSSITPESKITMDHPPQKAIAIYDFVPSKRRTELRLKKGQTILIGPIAPYTDDWLFARDEVERKVGWVPASYIRFLEPLAVNSVDPASSQAQTALAIHHGMPSCALKTMRKGLWWQAYLVLRTDDESKEFVGFNSAISNEFASLTSSYITDRSICERISTLLSRAESASHDFSPVFLQMKNMREHRAFVIKIAKTIEESEFGFDVAMLGWACVAVFLALYDPLFTNKSSLNLTPIETKTLTKTFQQLQEITSIIARYAVKENIFSKNAPMSLAPEYEEGLTDLAVTIFRWFAHAFIVWKGFCPREEDDSPFGRKSNDRVSELVCKGLMEEIWAKEKVCGKFRVVCGAEGNDGVKVRESSESGSGSGSDGDWEKVDDELHEEGIILDHQRFEL